MGKYVTGTGQTLQTHNKKACKGNCLIHNPSDHHMKDWPTCFRWDSGVMERICPHGIGHPDPDHMAFARAHYMGGRHPEHIDAQSVHGCDGCCKAPE